MPTSTVWRRPLNEISRRGASPTRIANEEIERITPERDLSIQYMPYATHTTHASGRREQHSSAYYGLGLGLSSAFATSYDGHSDRLYIDQDGEAHVGAKLRPPQHEKKRSERRPQSSRAPRNSSNSWQTPRQKGHTRSGSNLEDLANVAAAISPQLNMEFAFLGSPNGQFTRPNTSYINGYSHDSYDRPSKRIRSERLHPAGWSERGERPKSSYAPSTQRTQEELDAAEMMLGLFGRDYRMPFSAPVEAVERELMDAPPQIITQQAPTSGSISNVDDTAIKHMPALHSSSSNDTSLNLNQPLPETYPEQTTIDFSHIPALIARNEPGQQPGRDTEMQDAVPAGDELSAAVETETAARSQLPPIQAATGTAELEADELTEPPVQPAKKQRRIKPETLAEDCAACHKAEFGNANGETITPWLGCEACKNWFHLPCAGFKDQQEVQAVDKYICKDCAPIHGETTFVRKSSRPRHAIDYAGLNEGVVKSSAVTTMHHYVPKFKDGSIVFKPDDFARIRPELLTEELWENMTDKRPFVVPACWNPRFGQAIESKEEDITSHLAHHAQVTDVKVESTEADETLAQADMLEPVIDVDQDYLDMVMPRNLTVQKVAELYGPDEPVPVIDVKSQGEKGKFTLQQWADYYDAPEKKQIRNVISLEVSNSRLGRLIRRPKVVRDIDLEDQVWDAESRRASNKKPVQFYCLMSVEDSYTDFHIDFGGSSVYYHILKGIKTFFFIPPEEKYLKKYEEWCLSDTQNETWLGDLCNGNVTRVDLYEGDTAFIPAGWIHSVWTPKDSLVIGGNFLTRYDLDMQIKVQQIEKVTKVPPRYRYPFFQKVMWYTMIKYLEDDPVPEHIIEEFKRDPEYRYLRANPIWKQHLVASPLEEPDDAEYNARYYSKNELRGLVTLRDFIYRTARIHADLPVDNPPNKKQADSVRASIPKQYGDPLQLVCLFAVWCAWKLGNVTAPDWIHAEHEQQELEKHEEDKQKKAHRVHIPGERVSTRNRKTTVVKEATPEVTPDPEVGGPGIKASIDARLAVPRIACESCRKRRTKCRHQDQPTQLDETAQETLEKSRSYSNVTVDVAKLARASPVVVSASAADSSLTPQSSTALAPVVNPASQPPIPPTTTHPHETTPEYNANTDLVSLIAPEVHEASLSLSLADMNNNIMSRPPPLQQLPPSSSSAMMNGDTPGSAKKGRSKACEECRKSKRRCVHDEYGRVDPAKAAEPSKPRGSSNAKRPIRLSDEHVPKRVKSEYSSHEDDYAVYAHSNTEIDAMIDPALLGHAQQPSIEYRHLQQPLTDVNAMSLPPDQLPQQHGNAVSNGFVTHWANPQHAALIAAQAQQMMIDPQLQPTMLPQLETATSATPEHDKSFSPITAESASANTPVASGMPPTMLQSNIDPALSIDSVTPAIQPEIIETAQIPVTDGVRRHSSLTTATSPKQEVTSNRSRRSSSQTSGTIHRLDAIGAGDPEHPMVSSVEKPLTATSHDSITVARPHLSSPDSKIAAASHEQRRTERAGTAASNTSELDEDEKMARELQAQEHGLRRRRGSLRAS